VDDETRKRLQTNAGIQVLVVAEDSPAFQADVLPGDVVLTVGNDTVQSMESYYQLLNKYEGHIITFRLDRDGKTVEKQIEIRPYSKKMVP
jgi:S1-C subfamily serine protease